MFLFIYLLSPSDVIGVVKTVEDVTRITTKNSREVSKRNVHLMDMSARVITVTMWGAEVSLPTLAQRQRCPPPKRKVFPPKYLFQTLS